MQGVPEATYVAWIGHSLDMSRKQYVSPTADEFKLITNTTFRPELKAALCAPNKERMSCRLQSFGWCQSVASKRLGDRPFRQSRFSSCCRSDPVDNTALESSAVEPGEGQMGNVG